MKMIRKFKDPFILNLNLFVAPLFHDSKSHVNLLIILNGTIVLIECNFQL